jgi:hypothetical protein
MLREPGRFEHLSLGTKCLGAQNILDAPFMRFVRQ